MFLRMISGLCGEISITFDGGGAPLDFANFNCMLFRSKFFQHFDITTFYNLVRKIFINSDIGLWLNGHHISTV